MIACHLKTGVYGDNVQKIHFRKDRPRVIFNLMFSYMKSM